MRRNSTGLFVDSLVSAQIVQVFTKSLTSLFIEGYQRARWMTRRVLASNEWPQKVKSDPIGGPLGNIAEEQTDD